MLDGNIWYASLKICRILLPFVLIFIVAGVILDGVNENRNTGTEMNGVKFFVLLMLAIPAHMTALTGVDANSAALNWFKMRKGLWSFGWRTFVLSLISLAPMIVAVVVAINSDFNREMAIAIGLLVMLFATCVVFSLLGTMLPSVVIGGDTSFKAAALRGGRTFSYALPRLFVAFGVVSVVQVLFPISATVLLQSDLSFFPAGGFDPVSVLIVAAANAIGAFQVVMIAVILSRSYLWNQRAVALSAI